MSDGRVTTAPLSQATAPLKGVAAVPLQTAARPAGGGIAPRWRSVWRRLKEGGALMVGVPDYERYVAHMRAHHPHHEPLSRAAFVHARMEARYGGRGAGKCPC